MKYFFSLLLFSSLVLAGDDELEKSHKRECLLIYLPYELLDHIFDYTKDKKFRNVRVICSRLKLWFDSRIENFSITLNSLKIEHSELTKVINNFKNLQFIWINTMVFKYISFSNNDYMISETLLQIIAKFQLKELHLCKMRIPENGFEIISDCTSLKALSLSNTYAWILQRFGPGDLPYLSKLTNLTSLNLEGNNILNDEGIFPYLPNLTRLDLSWTQGVTKKTIKCLSQMSSLKSLNLLYAHKLPKDLRSILERPGLIILCNDRYKH